MTDKIVLTVNGVVVWETPEEKPAIDPRIEDYAKKANGDLMRLLTWIFHNSKEPEWWSWEQWNSLPNTQKYVGPQPDGSPPSDKPRSGFELYNVPLTNYLYADHDYTFHVNIPEGTRKAELHLFAVPDSLTFHLTTVCLTAAYDNVVMGHFNSFHFYNPPAGRHSWRVRVGAQGNYTAQLVLA